MRNKHILHGLGLTLIATMLLSVCTAAPQKPSVSRSMLVPQIASDAIGFDSGFWRSEYLQQPKEDKDKDKDKDKTDASSSDLMATATASGSAKQPPAAFVYSDTLITVPLDTPAVIDIQLGEASSQLGLVEETTMSEWENAVAESGASVTPGSTISGPSVTSAIVGFVGIMIVLGAYVSSGKRNR